MSVTIKEKFGSGGEALQSATDDLDDLRCFIAVYSDGRTQAFVSEECRVDAAGMWWLSMMLATAVADVVGLPLTDQPEDSVPEGTVVQ